ncbi:M23 family metallopeptidase [Roseivivax sp. CAU 1753]
MKPALCALFVLTSAAATAAEVPFLHWPVDCTLGQTCFIEDYADAQDGPGMRDHACGLKSRDGHHGTDIALLSEDAMREGVDVLASAPGVVEAVRDGVPDRRLGDPGEVAGQECGNAVRLAHSSGHQTLYCHMAEGSVAVAPGDRVAAGDRLGRVGLSGQTNFAHLHIAVLKDGVWLDPFAPDADGVCGSAQATLWVSPPAYTKSGLFTAGFSPGVPSFDDVRTGAARVTDMGPGDPLVVYGHMFHPAPGDVLQLSARGPDGPVFSHRILVKDARAEGFRAYGKRAPATGWPAGAYEGSVRLTRGDTIIAVRHAHLRVR